MSNPAVVCHAGGSAPLMGMVYGLTPGVAGRAVAVVGVVNPVDGVGDATLTGLGVVGPGCEMGVAPPPGELLIGALGLDGAEGLAPVEPLLAPALTPGPLTTDVALLPLWSAMYAIPPNPAMGTPICAHEGSAPYCAARSSNMLMRVTCQERLYR